MEDKKKKRKEGEKNDLVDGSKTRRCDSVHDLIAEEKNWKSSSNFWLISEFLIEGLNSLSSPLIGVLLEISEYRWGERGTTSAVQERRETKWETFVYWASFKGMLRRFDQFVGPTTSLCFELSTTLVRDWYSMRRFQNKMFISLYFVLGKLYSSYIRCIS